MKVKLSAALAIVGSCVSAVPTSAQFFFQSKDLAGQPVRGDEPGIIGQPLPGATPEELRAGLTWTMRAALNVAALQCQFEPTFNTVRNYNALLADHREELAGSFATLEKYFVRTAGSRPAGQKALDQFGTRTYSSVTPVAAQFGFCQAANGLGRDANFTPRGHFGEFAEARMQELRNSLVPYGEQRFSRYLPRNLTAAKPRLDSACWNRKGEYQAKKCGPLVWPTSTDAAPVGIAAR